MLFELQQLLEVIRMQYLAAIGLLVFSYLLGAVPFGLVIVRLKTGKDIRQVASGRTGGTNVMRAAGFLAGDEFCCLPKGLSGPTQRGEA